MIQIADQILEFSNKVGGAKVVFEGHNSLLIGGFTFTKADLPVSPNVLPAGTPILIDEEARTIKIHYAFEVSEAVTSGKVVKVKKGIEGTRVKKGMFLMAAPTTYGGTGQGYEVASVVTTNTEFDTITLNAEPGALTVGAILVECTAKDATAKVKVVPNALTDRDKRVSSDAKSINGDGVWASDRPVLERRIPPIADCIKKALRDNECYFRFSKRK